MDAGDQGQVNLMTGTLGGKTDPDWVRQWGIQDLRSCSGLGPFFTSLQQSWKLTTTPRNLTEILYNLIE